MKDLLPVAPLRSRLCLLLLFLSIACQSAPEPAELVLRGGKIVTLDPSKPEVQAMAIRRDRIAAVGSDDEIASYIGPSTEVIDLQGRLATPGFIEGHGHLLGIGQRRTFVDLSETRTWQQAVDQVAQAVKKSLPDTWILGGGWHQEKWESPLSRPVAGYPTHHEVSAVSPHNPVFLAHASGHACLANARALEAAGVTASTPDPPGGEIVRDRRGEPTGVFRETAQELIREAVQRDRSQRSGEQTEAQARQQTQLAQEECFSKGVTSFQDAGSTLQTVDLLKKLVREGSLKLRLYVMLREDNQQLSQALPHHRVVNFGDRRLTVRAIKKSIDGALGTHGAWLLEPYSDYPESTGFNTSSLEEIAMTARLAVQQGFQLCVHAIGDRANREALNIYEKIFREFPDKRDLRWRIEHAQHLHPSDVPRFSRLNVIASIQGIHCVSDAPWAIGRLGNKRAREGAYIWRSLLKTNVLLVNGTDAPVEDVDPIASFHASVSRRLNDGTLFFPEQRMSRQEALKSYTINAAYAAFEEDIKGSLSPGKLADVVVLSKDILSVPEEEIRQARVLYTIVGGEVVYQLATDN